MVSDTITKQHVEDAGYFCRECGVPITHYLSTGECPSCGIVLFSETIGQEPLRVMTVEEHLERLKLNVANTSEKLRKNGNRNGEKDEVSGSS